MASFEQFKETFWERHSDPKSGWCRVLVIPVLLYAVYHRNSKVAAAAIVFTAINPFLFSPPKDEQAWMTRVVLAEQWWTDEQGESVLGLFLHPTGRLASLLNSVECWRKPNMSIESVT